MGRNDYAKKLNERRRQRDELMLFWGMQICADAITFALNDPEVMGRDTLGRTRIKRIEQAIPGIASEILKGIVKSEEADYQRETVDRGLKQIMGPDFVPWALRYEGWEDNV